MRAQVLYVRTGAPAESLELRRTVVSVQRDSLERTAKMVSNKEQPDRPLVIIYSHERK